MKVAAEYNK